MIEVRQWLLVFLLLMIAKFELLILERVSLSVFVGFDKSLWIGIRGVRFLLCQTYVLGNERLVGVVDGAPPGKLRLLE